MKRRVRSFLFLALVFSLAASAGLAQETISVTVDATKTQQKLLHTHLVMPVKAGPLTLYYPKWIPGEHGPDGPMGANLTHGPQVRGGQGRSVSVGDVICWMFSLSTSKFPAASAILISTSTTSSLTAIQPLTNCWCSKMEWQSRTLYPADIPAEEAYV